MAMFFRNCTCCTCRSEGSSTVQVLAHHLGPEHRGLVHRRRAQDRFVRDRATEPRRALSYRVPVVYGAAIFQRSTRRSPAWCSGRRPRPVPAPRAGLAGPTDRPRVGDGNCVEDVEVIRAFRGHDQVGGGAGGWLGGGHGAEHGNGAVDGSSSKTPGLGAALLLREQPAALYPISRPPSVSRMGPLEVGVGHCEQRVCRE
jgi:hypothetical protein